MLVQGFLMIASKAGGDLRTRLKTQDLAASTELVGIEELQAEVLEPQGDGVGADAQAPLQEQASCCRIVVVLKFEPSSMAPQARLCWMKLQGPGQDLAM